MSRRATAECKRIYTFCGDCEHSEHDNILAETVRHQIVNDELQSFYYLLAMTQSHKNAFKGGTHKIRRHFQERHVFHDIDCLTIDCKDDVASTFKNSTRWSAGSATKTPPN